MADDEKDLVPATDEEIAQAIKEVLDEQEEERLAELNAPDTPEEIAFMKEFDKAKTPRERYAVMEKYGYCGPDDEMYPIWE